MTRIILLLGVATLSGCLFPITTVSTHPLPFAMDALARDTTVQLELRVRTLDGAVINYVPPVLIGPRGIAGYARRNGRPRLATETPRDSVAGIEFVRRETNKVREFVVMSAVTITLYAAVTALIFIGIWG